MSFNAADTLKLKGLPQGRLVLLTQALLVTCYSLHLTACVLQCNRPIAAGQFWLLMTMKLIPSAG